MSMLFEDAIHNFTNKGTIHTDSVLTNISLRYGNGPFVWDKIMPRIGVAKDSDIYYVYDRSNFDTVTRSERGVTAPYNKVNSLNYSTDNYRCAEHAIYDLIDDTERDNVDRPLNLDVDMTENLTAMQMLGVEKAVADIVTAAATYATSGNTTTLTGTQQFNNASFDSDSKTDAIEARIDAAKEAIRQQIGMDPNTIVIPAAVSRVVKKDSEIRELIKYTQNNLLVNGDLPPTMFNLNVVIPGAVYNSANEGQAFSSADIWGKHMWIGYVRPGGMSLKTQTFGGVIMSQDPMIERWREDKNKSDAIGHSVKYVPKVISEFCGYLYRDVIA